MFNYKYHRLNEEVKVKYHFDFFKREIGLFEGVAFIISGTIGAGILGLPYAISKVGPIIGIMYIIVLGLLMMGMNLMLGEILVRTKDNLQIVGLAGRYLGKAGGVFMTIMMYSSLLGILVVYIIGEGKALSALFGGQAVLWSLLFLAAASVFIFRGLKTFKVFDFFLTVSILMVISIITLACAPHIKTENFSYMNFSNLLFPYGVVLFAFGSSGAVVESHRILKNSEVNFKKAIIIAGTICLAVYAVFALAVLGVTGQETSEIATIGLTSKVSYFFSVFGNLFAALAMGTSFLVGGLSLKHSLNWDYKVPRGMAAALVCLIPLVIFLLGLRSFITAIDIVGGVFMSLEMLAIILIYWRAKRLGDIQPGKYHLDHIYLLAAILVFAFVVGAANSVVKLF